MNLITVPFSVYDFFGILSAGFIVFTAADYAFARHWLLQDHFTLIAGIFWIVAAYIAGHIVANIAGFVLEEHVVRRWLRSPEETLFHEPGEDTWQHRLFPGHHRPLPKQTQQRVLQKAATAGITETERALFYHAHPIVMRTPIVREPLDSFRNSYSFCRNACMALIFALLILLAGGISHVALGTPTGAEVWWAMLGALAAAIGMFYRYLKYFRDYTIEVFRTYAELDNGEKS